MTNLRQAAQQGPLGSIALARSLCYEINGAADDSDDMDGGGYGSVDIAEILSAEVLRLQKALAQPEQQAEPVACRFCHSKKGCWTWHCYHCGEIDDVQKPAPPQREWVGLTDEEIENAISDGFARGLDDGNVPNKIVINYGRVIEASLKEKNA